MIKNFSLFAGILLFTNAFCTDFDPQKYYLGTTYRANSEFNIEPINSWDLHYNWELGYFFMNGYTKVIADPNKPIIFLKNTGDEVALWFRLNQEINRLNDSESLFITDGGVNHKRDKGLGTLCINYIDYQNFSHSTPYNDYLKALSVGADTNVTFFEEGDYDVTLNYRVKDDSPWLWSWNSDYCIKLKFSVRNGNCMIFLRDVKTQEELTTSAPNGFYLDLTKSRYLDINVKKEVLEDNSDKLDVRFNKPAKDGDQYTEKGVYTITLKNRYTKEVTTKVISVGDDPILNTYASTLMPIGKIKKHIQNAKNPKNQLNIKLKDIPDNMKLKIKVKPYKSDLKPDNSKQQNESVNISLPITNQESISDTKDATNNTDSFQKTDDSDLSQKLASIEKEVSEQLSKDLGNHKIEKIEAIYLSQEETTYLSKEYIEELQYNSLANEYFGYSLRELEKQFGEEKYVFTLDKDNKTTVRLFKNIEEDIFWGKVVKDIAIGSGVILVSATVAVASGGTIGVIFVAAAKTGIYTAFSSALCSSVIAGTITGIQTKNFDKTIKSMVVAGAEGFKWGAIAGAVAGGASKAWELRKAAKLASSEKARELIKRGLEFQKYVHQKLGGKLEPIYYKGKEISTAVKGCSKPDIVRNVNGRLEAIETKSYDLDKGISGLISKLRSQVAERVQNLPEGSLQRIIIDKRKYSKELLDEVRKKIQEGLMDVYKDIPVDFM